MPNSERGFVISLTLLAVVIVVSLTIVGGSLILKTLTGKDNQVTQIMSMPNSTSLSSTTKIVSPGCSDKNIYEIKGQDMFPGFVHGDTWQYQEYQETSPQRGDVVTLNNPFEKKTQVLRRVIGLPGEKLKILNNRVYINDENLSESYLHDTFSDIEPDFVKNGKEILIPQEKYILLADNRSTLSDSRNWGFIDKGDIGTKLVKKVTVCSKEDLSLNPANDETIKNDISTLHDLLDCHFTKSKKYPSDIYAISSLCLKEFDYAIHFNPNTNAPYNYIVTEGGSGYSLKATVSTGKDYSSAADDLYYDGNSLFIKPDQIRLSDVSKLTEIINSFKQNNSSKLNALCNGKSTCIGRTHPASPAASNIDGTGWIKANLSTYTGIEISFLPIDPKNSTKYHYAYCAIGDNWEINLVLVASENKSKMESDGGDNPTKYEIGTDLMLMGHSGCSY